MVCLAFPTLIESYAWPSLRSLSQCDEDDAFRIAGMTPDPDRGAVPYKDQ